MPIHPFFVHFPIAFVTLATALYAVSLFVKKQLLRDLFFWSLIIALIMLAISLISGLFAEDGIQFSQQAQEVLEEHENLAYTLVTGIFGLTAWYAARRKIMQKSEEILYGVVLISMLMLTFLTAQHGGQLVYRHGIGVEVFQGEYK
jgi:uncharacterized membrane protein